jgi:PAS domain S-box-containing protein
MSERSRAPDLGSEREVEEGLGDPFTAAFRGSRTPMLITDPRQADNPIVFVNDAFTGLTGYAREEAIGRNCRFLQGPETDRAVVDDIRNAVGAGEGIETEILNYKIDGTPFWNALVISPVRDEAGRLLYFSASQYDVTEKKRTEIELIRTRDMLEREVARRTRDLQAALDQKTMLLHEVDHRVKNNLQVVASLVLLKARRIKDKAAQRVLDNMAERISTLSTVHRLLYSVGDVSRFDVGAFVTDLSNDLMGALGNGRVALALDAQSVPVSAAKATSIALLVNELMSNALKHAFPNGRKGQLALQVSRLDDAVRIVVEDDGVGFAEQASSDESFGRTLVDMLVRQLKANIEFRDARPGTRAVIVLPLNAEEAQL